MALFITFEGGEGSGKSSQARTLYRKLLRLGIPAVLTHEPGGTVSGERITRLLKWSKNTNISPLTELLLFNASRAQLINDVIKPGLAEGKVIICDRFTDSTVSYQSYGRGLDPALVKRINDTAVQGIKPGLTVLMDLPVEEGLARKKDEKHDRFEMEHFDFHQKVRKGYLSLAAQEPDRFLVIDATQVKAKVRDIIWKKVESLL